MSKPVVDEINYNVLNIIRETNPDRYVLATGGGKKSYESISQLSSGLFEFDLRVVTCFLSLFVL